LWSQQPFDNHLDFIPSVFSFSLAKLSSQIFHHFHALFLLFSHGLHPKTYKVACRKFNDFNDNSFDTSKWLHYKVSDVELYERNQRLEFVWTGGTGGAGDTVTSTKVFELKADKEYEICVTVVTCGEGASLSAFVNERNFYAIGISPTGELRVGAVVEDLR
jgi:hypothetical protein